MWRLLLSILLSLSAWQASPQNFLWKSGNNAEKSAHIPVEATEGRIETKKVHQLLRDQILFGESFVEEQYRRMPLTYYHPRGPLGMAMQQSQWFRERPNQYHSDARLPTSMVGLGAGPMNLLIQQFAGACWSEPSVAVIGMNAGTVASYARPFQPFHFYEQNADIVKLNEGKDRLFPYVADARARGAQVKIFHGPPRLQLAKHGPARFYKLMVMEACSGENGEKIYLDLFTKEAIAECMGHIAEDGILCVHTSHRFVKLPPILAAIAQDLKLACMVGRDFDIEDREITLKNIGHSSSEWVFLARGQKVLAEACMVPAGYAVPDQYWEKGVPAKQIWTDKGPNLLTGVLRGHPLSSGFRNRPDFPVERAVCAHGAKLANSSDYLQIADNNCRME